MGIQRNESGKFKKPHIISKKWGTIQAEMSLKAPEKLPETSSAMSYLAQSEHNDDMRRKNGFDDYIISFNQLMNAFDTFVREYGRNYLNTQQQAGFIEIYDLNNPRDVTILLCWYLRNPGTHRGNLVDEQCKKQYELIYNEASSKGISPLIELPSELHIGEAFTVCWTDYVKIKEAVFLYVGDGVTEEDVRILRVRSSITNMKLTDIEIMTDVEDYMIILNMSDLAEKGKLPTMEKGGFNLPICQVYLNDRRVIFIEDGTAVPAKIIHRSDYERNLQLKNE